MSIPTSVPRLRPHFTAELHRWIRDSWRTTALLQSRLAQLTIKLPPLYPVWPGQSSPKKVLWPVICILPHNLESPRVQQRLVERAQRFGWSEPRIIGCTVSGVLERSGFERFWPRYGRGKWWAAD